MHSFYEDDKDSKPDMLLTKTGLYSKADIYLDGKDSNLSVDAWLIPIDQDHLTSLEQVDVSRYSNMTDIVEYMNCKTNKKRWLDMISSRDLVFAGMRLASRKTADDFYKYNVDYYEPSHEWIYDPEDGEAKFFDTKEEAIEYAKKHMKD